MRERSLFRVIGKVPYRLSIKGNTVVDIDPEGMLYQRDHHLQDRAPMREGTRFVPEDRIVW